jgi:hypothetical protein
VVVVIGDDDNNDKESTQKSKSSSSSSNEVMTMMMIMPRDYQAGPDTSVALPQLRYHVLITRQSSAMTVKTQQRYILTFRQTNCSWLGFVTTPAELETFCNHCMRLVSQEATQYSRIYGHCVTKYS